jgi:hypothetical protein
MPTTEVFEPNPKLEQLEVGPGADITLERTPEEDAELIRWIRKEKAAAKEHVEKWRHEAKRAYRFRDGKQLTEEDQKLLRQQQRPDNAFNAAQKFIRFVTGIERYAPEALIFSPIDESNEAQQMLSEFVTRCYDWAIAKGSGNYERSCAFEDLLVTGVGILDYYVSRNSDPKGIPQQCRINPLEMWWPASEKQNMGIGSDSSVRWLGRESLIDRQEALSRWPEESTTIRAGLTDSEMRERPEAEGTVQYTIPFIETKPIETSELGGKKDQLRILEWQWFDDEPGYYFFDPLEGEDVWLDESKFRKYRAVLYRLLRKDVSDYVRQSKRIYQKVFLLNSKHRLGDILNLPGDRFTWNVMTAHYDEEDKIFYGFERVLIDPQRYANKFFNQVLEIMGHQAKGGFLYEEGAVSPKQVDQIDQNYNKPGTWQEVNAQAISGGKLKEKPLPQLPAPTMTLMEYCIRMMENVSGIQPENAFGQGVHDVPGVTLRQKQKSGLLLLAQEFDSLSRFRIEEGKIIFEQLKLLADNRLIRVGSPMDGEVIKLMHAPFALDYDLNLDDTERDPNIRHLYTENVLAIAPTLIRMIKFLPELLDYMVLPVKIRMALKHAIRSSAEAEMRAAQAGIQKAGRGSPVSPQERAAKVQKIQADTQVQMARAKRIEGQKLRDEAKTIIEALAEFHRAKLERDKTGSELAAKALELYDRARGIRPLEDQNKAEGKSA